MTGAPRAWTDVGPPVRGRSCGTCTSCCTLVPVLLDEGVKPATTRCPHQRAKGCGIYPTRPRACAVWSCRWLFDPDTAAMRRPDHAGYIVDPGADTAIRDGKPVQVVQVWCDPARRDAWQEPALLAYLDGIAQRHGMSALIRWGSNEGLAVLAPCLSPTGDWLGVQRSMQTAEQIDAQLAQLGVVRPYGRLEAELEKVQLA